MDRFNISVMVEGVELKRKVTASSEREAIIMCENHLKWIYPTKKIVIGEVIKETNKGVKKLKGKWPHED